MLYFDANATVPMTHAARLAWNEAQDTAWTNPSSPTRTSARVRARIEEARGLIADLLGIDSSGLVFCSGATEAANIIIASCARGNPQGHVLCSSMEHACVRESLKLHFPGRVRLFNPTLPVSDFEQTLSGIQKNGKSPCLVIAIAANNETGTMLPWIDYAGICRQSGVPFFSDMAQWIGKMPLQGLGDVDFFCSSGHKFGAPKGIGILKVSGKFWEVTGQRGGGQEHGIRSGTGDYPAIHALARALESAAHWDGQELLARQTQKQSWIQKLKERIPGVSIFGESLPGLWNTIAFAPPHGSRTDWIIELEKRGFLIGSGSACSSAHTGSHVLDALGVDPSTATRALRVSGMRDHRPEDWQALLDAIQDTAASFVHNQSGLSEVIEID